MRVLSSEVTMSSRHAASRQHAAQEALTAAAAGSAPGALRGGAGGVRLAAESSRLFSYRAEEKSAAVWLGSENGERESSQAGRSLVAVCEGTGEQAFRVEISAAAMAAARGAQPLGTLGGQAGAAWSLHGQQGEKTAAAGFEWKISKEDRQKAELLEGLLSFLLGKKVKLVLPGEEPDGKEANSRGKDAAQAGEGANKSESSAAAQNSVSTSGRAAATAAGGRFVFRLAAVSRNVLNGGLQAAGGSFAVTVRRAEFYREEEQLLFAAAGTARTAEGKEVSFRLSLSLKREYVEMSRWEMFLGGGQTADPLVINYAGRGIAFSGEKIAFDLDGDGTPELVPFLAAGSGFLVLDKDGDGRITWGGELFGPATGNAFKELAAYDADGSGWIDEGDEVFCRLRVWGRDASGHERLWTLGELGIGALYLGSAEAEFDFRDAANQPLATGRRTGVFLRENGAAGTLQQVDLAV